MCPPLLPVDLGRRWLALLAPDFCGVLLAGPVAAQGASQCGPRAAVIAALTGTYQESRRAIGVSANALVMEVYAAASGSWTITVTNPQGMTCLVASGQGFEVLTDPLPAPGVPG